MNVLVLAAHPDDEILGPGGTLARHALDGDTVHAVILSEGISSRYAPNMKATLEESGQQAAVKIGFRSIRFEAFPDQRLDTIPLVEITQRIETIVEELAPEVVYTHFPGDVNADHGIVARAAWTACRPYRFPGVRRLLAFETPSSTEWSWPLPDGGFSPNVSVDVSATLDAKVAALECYGSELRDYPHPRSARAIRERAAFWGSRAGLQAAEPFILLREVVRPALPQPRPEAQARRRHS